MTKWWQQGAGGPAEVLRNAAGNHADHTPITVPRWAAALGAQALVDSETEQGRIDEAVLAVEREHDREKAALSKEINDYLTAIDSSLDEIEDRLAEITRLRQKIANLV